ASTADRSSSWERSKRTMSQCSRKYGRSRSASSRTPARWPLPRTITRMGNLTEERRLGIADRRGIIRVSGAMTPRSVRRPWRHRRSTSRSCFLDLAALAKRHHGERRSGVRDVMLGVPVRRTREPTAALPLVGLQPGDSLLDPHIVGRDARLAQHIDDKTGGVAVTGGKVLFLFVNPLVVAEGGQCPAAIRLLKGGQLLDTGLFLRRTHEAVEVTRR